MKITIAEIVFFFLLGLPVHSQPASTDTIHTVLFHQVSPTSLEGPCASPDYFRDVLRMIQISGKSTVFASEIVDFLDRGEPLGTDKVAITFDDGWSGMLDYAQPLLQQFEMRATFFAATHCMKTGRPRYVNWNDLHAMAESGVWEVNSHSVTHADLVEINDTELQYELQISRQELIGHGFSPVSFFAYPFGHTDERVSEATRQSGYQAGFIAGPDPRITSESDRYQLPRTTICQLFNQDLVCRKLGFDMSAIRRQIAIYDETEGAWNEGCISKISDITIPIGLYGSTYIQATRAQAKWWINVPIESPGRYQFSIWTPVNTDDGAASMRQTGIWQIRLLNGNTFQRTEIPPRTPNGWTTLASLECFPDTYQIILTPRGNRWSQFLVDALKVEKIAP